jgi:DNA-directed RNA polymerase specialized sigma24 family protein
VKEEGVRALDGMSPHDCYRFVRRTAPEDSALGLFFVAFNSPDAHGHVAGPLTRLEHIHRLRARLAEEEDEAALTARREGATWAQIGDALGLTRQAVHSRWGNIARFANWGPADDHHSEERT